MEAVGPGTHLYPSQTIAPIKTSARRICGINGKPHDAVGRPRSFGSAEPRIIAPSGEFASRRGDHPCSRASYGRCALPQPTIVVVPGGTPDPPSPQRHSCQPTEPALIVKTILPRCRPGGLGLRARNVLAGRLRVQVALAAALLCGTAVLLLQELKQRTASDGLINQVREAQLSTERLLLTLEDAETGQRGYLLTGNAAYLTPYEAAEAHLADRLRQLAAVPVSANPEWAGHVERISRVATAKMAELRRTVALSQAGDRAAALEVVQTDEGQQVMDAIRAEIEALRANADAQLTRARRQEWSYGLAVAGTASGLALLVCLLLGGLYVAQRRARLVLAEFTSAFGLAQGMIRDLKGCITYWNSGAERLYGYPESEALGRVWHELLRTTFPRPREELEAELLQTGQWQGELTHLRRDGAELVVASHWALHRDADGGPALVIEVDNDITALKRAETALAEREARLVEVAETIPGLVFVTDAAGENVYTNRRFQEFVGAPAEALLGKSWVKVLHPEGMPRAGEIWQSSVRTEQAYEAEYRFRRADGAWHWFLVRAAPLRGSNGAVESWYGVCTDITEMVAAREALLRQGEHLERQVAERTTALADSERSLRLLIEGVVDYAILHARSGRAGEELERGRATYQGLPGRGNHRPAFLPFLHRRRPRRWSTRSARSRRRHGRGVSKTRAGACARMAPASGRMWSST